VRNVEQPSRTSALGQSRRMPLRTGVGPLPLFPETGRESEGSDSDALCQERKSWDL
jgi:hypothetical protein